MSIDSPSSVVFCKPPLAHLNHGIWCLARGLLKYFHDQDAILISAINDTPILAFITYSQFVTARANIG